MFFNLFRTRPQGLRPQNKGEVFLRTVLLICVAVGMIWAFWANSERYVHKFKAQGRISDDAGRLDRKSRDALRDLIADFERKYAIKVQLKVSPVPIVSSQAVPGEVFLGVCPPQRQLVLIMPEAWARILGEGLLYRLRNETIPPYFASGDWGAGLVLVLRELERGFGQAAGARAF